MSSSRTIAEMILEATQILRRSGVPEARREASSLLQYVLDRDHTFIITHAEASISPEQSRIFKLCVERRASGEPLQYITGRQAFFGLEFEVTQDVLIPRPETELLVETAVSLLDRKASPRLCDVGTGSGCIAIALLHEHHSAFAIAIDLSEAAIRVARRNALRHAVGERLSLVLADCFTAFGGSRTTFDLVVSNPPYVAGSAMNGLQREVRDHEPKIALAAGSDGLSIIRRLVAQSADFLKPGGHLLFEIGFDQGATVDRLIDRNVWKLLEIHPDLQGIPRIVALQKIAA